MRTTTPRLALFALGLLGLSGYTLARLPWRASPVEDALERLGRIGKMELREWRWKLGENSKGGEKSLDSESWARANPGHQWQGENSEGWYRKEIEIPASVSGFAVEGSAVVIEIGVDDHGEIWIDGKQAAKFSWDEGKAILTEKAKAGDRFTVAIRARNRGGPGGLLHARLSFAALADVERAVASYSEALAVARKVADGFGRGDDRWKSIVEKSAGAVDFTAAEKGDRRGLLGSLEKARAGLSPLAELTKDYSIRCVGYSHIDLAWLWRWRETVQVTKETFQSAINFTKEVDDFRFSMSQSHAYRWMEERYPELFAAIQKAVKEGRWEIVGGTAVELDCNLPDAESHVRQIVQGQRYFEEKFGRRAKIGWCPDSFGYNANLPQILKKSGMDYFVTAKISWNDTNKFPHNLFWWEAPDGSRVLTFLPMGGYTNDLTAAPMVDYLRQVEKQTGYKEIMMVYGVGNHGGGPTREMLEREKRLESMDFFPKIRKSTAIEYFDAVPAEAREKLPVWNDELYLEYHRGTYTTQAANKRANRKGEVGLTTAEKLASIASLLGAPNYPAAELETAWDYLLFNQMHDILPGSSITPVYRDSAEDYAKMFALTDGVIDGALAVVGARAAPETPPVASSASIGASFTALAFNTLSWERSDVARIELGAGDGREFLVHDLASGDAVPSQIETVDSRRTLIFLAKNVPPMGYRAYRVEPQPIAAAAPAAASSLGVLDLANSLGHFGGKLQNDALEVSVDLETGNLASVLHKASGREALAGPGNQLQLLEDKPKVYDAWELGFTGKEWKIDKAASVKLVEQGPVKWTVRVERTFLGDTKSRRKPTEDFPSSFFTQDITLYDGLPWVEMRMRADWWEDHICAKVAFPLSIAPPKATYEIPYATLERSTKRETPWEKARYEVSAQKWADYSEGGFGVSLLNEAKYGYDALGNVLRLTCFRAPTSPDPSADRGRHEFTYALFPHNGDWRSGGTVRAAYEFNHPLVVSRVPAAGPFASASGGTVGFGEQWGGTSFAPFAALGVGSRLRPGDGGATDPPAGATRAPRATPGLRPVAGLSQRKRAAAQSFLACDAPNVLVPVMKAADREDAIVVRLYEWAGEGSTKVALKFGFPVAKASLVNLLEENPKPLEVAGDTVRLTIGRNAIETILVVPSR